MTYAEVIRAGIPGASPGLCEHILWGMTLYPFGPVSPKTLYRAASRFRRAAANGVTLCDFCENRATDGSLCPNCNTALIWPRTDVAPA